MNTIHQDLKSATSDGFQATYSQPSSKPSQGLVFASSASAINPRGLSQA